MRAARDSGKGDASLEQDQITHREPDPAGFDVEAAITEAMRAVELAIVPSFFARIVDPRSAAPLTSERILFGHFNEPMKTVTGLEDGSTLAELLPPRAAGSVLANYCRACASPGAISYPEDIEVPSGSAAWQTTIKALRDPSGTPFAIMGYSTDVTEIRRRELADAEMIARLKRTSDEVRVFSSMAAHDVRGPLATIESLLELVLDGFADVGNGKRELIDRVGEVVRTAREQMNELLEHGASLTQTVADDTVVDLGHLCRDLSALMDPEEEIAITHPDVGILCDRVALHLVLRNLLSNARRFCRSRLAIGIGETDALPGMLRFIVSDDGPGFPASFDPFAANDAAGAATAHGYGLAAVRFVVEMRGGTATTAPSVFGTGAGIAFTIPARIVPNERLDAEREAAPPDAARAA